MAFHLMGGSEEVARTVLSGSELHPHRPRSIPGKSFRSGEHVIQTPLHRGQQLFVNNPKLYGKPGRNRKHAGPDGPEPRKFQQGRILSARHNAVIQAPRLVRWHQGGLPLRFSVPIIKTFHHHALRNGQQQLSLRGGRTVIPHIQLQGGHGGVAVHQDAGIHLFHRDRLPDRPVRRKNHAPLRQNDIPGAQLVADFLGMRQSGYSRPYGYQTPRDVHVPMMPEKSIPCVTIRLHFQRTFPCRGK